jgi:hypothetical protein
MRRMRIGGFVSALALALAAALAGGSIALAQEQQSTEITVEVITPGSPATPAAYGALLDPVTGLSTVATYEPDQWTGAGQVTETESYGRLAAALYAQSTGFGTGSLDIALSDPSTEDVILTLVGLDDDTPGKTPIELTINQTVVYQGDAWFEDWGGTVGEGNWTTVEITIPKGLLGPGVNSITLSNTVETGNEGETPYVLLGGASIQVTGVTVEPISQS